MARIDYQDDSGNEYPGYQDPGNAQSPDQHPYYDDDVPDAPSPSTPPGSGSAGRQYSERELDFLRRNPGDYHRLGSAFADDNRPKGMAVPRAMQQLPQSPWASTFSDPLTKQYEQLLQAQLAMYQQQQKQMEEAVAAAKARRAAAEAAGKNLEGYVNERVTKLKGPAYTGSEQEVLRTQYLDPLERDRTAAQQRALQQIGARGMDPSSGVAQQLLMEVNRAFDEQRTRGQGAIATRQIEEQRSREQEAQQLLQYLTMLPDAMARGDLDFVNYTQGLVSQPGQQGLTIGKLLADIPSERLHDALATLGLGGSGSNTSAQLMALLSNAQNQRQQQNALNASAWSRIGWGL